MDLVAGQVIELVIPSAVAGGDDADLFLYNSSFELVDSSEGAGEVEQLTVPADGTYFVDVFAFSGAPLYRLSVGQSTVTSNVPGLRLSDDFIPGEVIVTLKSAGDPAAKSRKSDCDPRDPLRHEPERWRAGARDAAQAAGRRGTGHQRHDALVAGGDRDIEARARRNTRCRNAATLAGVSQAPRSSASSTRSSTPSGCAAIPMSAVADLNRVMRASAVPNDPGYATPALALRADPAPRRVGHHDG